MPKQSQKQSKKKLIITLSLAAVIIAGILIYYFIDNFVPAFGARADAELRMHFVDVGQGDCQIIEFPDGKTAIIDGGPKESEKSMLRFIKSLRLKTVDFVILTHSDADHCSGLTAILRAYKVTAVYMPDIQNPVSVSLSYYYFTEAVKNNISRQNIYINGPSVKIESGGAYLNFLSPTIDEYAAINDRVNTWQQPSAEQYNAVSPIMTLNYMGRKAVFTGDAITDTELKVAAVYMAELFDADVLKIAHHGSNTSTCPEFFLIVNPTYCIISVGLFNSYGHPHQETLYRLASKTVYRTDLNGSICARVSQDGELKLTPEKNA